MCLGVGSLKCNGVFVGVFMDGSHHTYLWITGQILVWKVSMAGTDFIILLKS